MKQFEKSTVSREVEVSEDLGSKSGRKDWETSEKNGKKFVTK